jgi:hypothetical protein
MPTAMTSVHLPTSTQVRQHLNALPRDARVLDLGGWFTPHPAATDVVDLMPYETRRATLSLEPQPGERFTRGSWHQADFLAPDFRLPFGDREIDFVYCGHTVEDLSEPGALLREMQRVGRSGCIVSPTRLTEQTRGVRDRVTGNAGHPHHYWIIDPLDGALRLCAKADSLRSRAAFLPLRHLERLGAAAIREFAFLWINRFDSSVELGEPAHARACEFARAQSVRPADQALDPLVRRLRAWKYRFGGRAQQPFENRWPEILRLSQSYSRIELSGR